MWGPSSEPSPGKLLKVQPVLSKRQGCLVLGMLIGVVLARAQSAYLLELTPNGEASPEERGKPPPATLTLEVHCWNQDEVKEFLIFAINQGTPLFNGGDHYGCYRIYEFAAKRIIWGSAHCPNSPALVQVGKALQTAVERAEAVPTAKEKAWTLRRAFDVIVERQAQ